MYIYIWYINYLACGKSWMMWPLTPTNPGEAPSAAPQDTTQEPARWKEKGQLGIMQLMFITKEYSFLISRTAQHLHHRWSGVKYGRPPPPTWPKPASPMIADEHSQLWIWACTVSDGAATSMSIGMHSEGGGVTNELWGLWYRSFHRCRPLTLTPFRILYTPTHQFVWGRKWPWVR